MNIDMNLEKIFKCGHTELSRMELESLPAPFYTTNVTDEEMEAIVEDIEAEMQDWQEWRNNGDISEEKFNEQWWTVMEQVVVNHGVPYYEDLN